MQDNKHEYAKTYCWMPTHFRISYQLVQRIKQYNRKQFCSIIFSIAFTKGSNLEPPLYTYSIINSTTRKHCSVSFFYIQIFTLNGFRPLTQQIRPPRTSWTFPQSRKVLISGLHLEGFHPQNEKFTQLPSTAFWCAKCSNAVSGTSVAKCYGRRRDQS